MSTLRKLTQWLRRSERPGDSFENTFAFQPDDVVIVSYPKSGSTWLRFIIANLLKFHEEVDFLRMQLTVPEISLEACRNGADFAALPSPRFMRSHALYDRRFPKVIYLMRDPRDVLLSYYHHVRKFHQFDGTLLHFLRSNVRRVEWDQHVNSWIFQNPSLDNLCLVRYEDMLNDTFAEIQKILRFAGLNRMTADIQDAVERSGFHRLRELEDRKGLGYVDDQNKEIRFIREGRKGGWQAGFAEEERTYAKEKLGAMLIRTGYESSLLW
jgi:Sulfotransferase domain